MSDYILQKTMFVFHEDVINGNTFCVTDHLCGEFTGHQWIPPVNSPHKGQWRGALMFSLICTWINGWVNNREAGDFRRYRANVDVTLMYLWMPWFEFISVNEGIPRYLPGFVKPNGWLIIDEWLRGKTLIVGGQIEWLTHYWLWVSYKL